MIIIILRFKKREIDLYDKHLINKSINRFAILNKSYKLKNLIIKNHFLQKVKENLTIEKLEEEKNKLK